MCVCVCLCVSVSAPEGINNLWSDMDQYDWSNKFYSCFIANVVGIINMHGLDIDTRHGN